MKQSMNWLAHLRAATEQHRDPLVYAQCWAHDVRCLRTGVTHRRVGLGSNGHDEWLQAGVAARVAQ
jgi:hypothetical protein